MIRLWLSVILMFVASPTLAAEFHLTSPVIKHKGTISNEQVLSG